MTIGGEKKIRIDAVYISHLPDDVTENKLGEYFGSIGVIKVCSVYIGTPVIRTPDIWPPDVSPGTD